MAADSGDVNSPVCSVPWGSPDQGGHSSCAEGDGREAGEDPFQGERGKSLDEIRAATGDVPRPGAVGGRGPAFASFTDVVYQELTKKRG